MAFLDNSGVTALVTRLKNYFALKEDIPTVPTAYTSNPAMDGTASAGTGTAYARGNHVHPHDTSKQDKLVSGTNIKTVNGDSILGSGDLTVGGGGYDYRIDVSISGSTVTADYNGSTLTEIATAVANDPATSVLVLIPTYDNPSAKGMILHASYDTDWGDIASTLWLATLMYDNADDRFYIRYVMLSGSGNSTKNYRCA